MCNPYITSRVIKYPSFVNQSTIHCQGSSGFRFKLEIDFVGKYTKDKLVVIMKNPSSASAYTCDNTISKVCNTAYYNGYSGVIIMNLFPIRATYARQIQSFYAHNNYHSIMSANLSLIQKISTGRDVVFAWGTDTIGGKRNYPNYYDNAIRNITSTIVNNTYYANRCKCKNSSCTTPSHSQIRYPLHGLAWCNHSTLIAY